MPIATIATFRIADCVRLSNAKEKKVESAETLLRFFLQFTCRSALFKQFEVDNDRMRQFVVIAARVAIAGIANDDPHVERSKFRSTDSAIMNAPA